MEYIKKCIPIRYKECQEYKSIEARNLSLLSRMMICNNIKVREEEIKLNKLKKPYVENGPYFNISHSKDYVVFVKSEKPIGIDIEYVNEKNLNILNYAYTENEREYILNAPDNLSQVERLTKFWTIKESLFKASGSEKYIEPKNIEVDDKTKLSFLGETYNINSFKHEDFFVSVASIIQYDDILFTKDTILRG